jgi:hypothetical protein
MDDIYEGSLETLMRVSDLFRKMRAYHIEKLVSHSRSLREIVLGFIFSLHDYIVNIYIRSYEVYLYKKYMKYTPYSMIYEIS